MLLDEIKKREAHEDKEVEHSAAYADVKRLKKKLAVVEKVSYVKKLQI